MSLPGPGGGRGGEASDATLGGVQLRSVLVSSDTVGDTPSSGTVAHRNASESFAEFTCCGTWWTKRIVLSIFLCPIHAWTSDSGAVRTASVPKVWRRS
jgi:hypothetical protein